MIPDAVIHHGAAVAAPKTFCGGGVPPLLARRSASSLRHCRNHRPSRAGGGVASLPGLTARARGVTGCQRRPTRLCAYSNLQRSGVEASAAQGFTFKESESRREFLSLLPLFGKIPRLTVAIPLQGGKKKSFERSATRRLIGRRSRTVDFQFSKGKIGSSECFRRKQVVKSYIYCTCLICLQIRTVKNLIGSFSDFMAGHAHRIKLRLANHGLLKTSWLGFVQVLYNGLSRMP